MLKPEQNQALMEVGPGTLMGDLLRRYWTPFAAAAEMDKQSTKAVRLLGEDLVLYRDQAGNYGLLDRHCPHRRADLDVDAVKMSVMLVRLRRVVALDAGENVVRAELAVVDRHAGLRVAAHEADPGHRARLEERRQRPCQDARVEIVRSPVRVEIAAREQRPDQGCPECRRRLVQLIDIGVLGTAQHRQRTAIGKIIGILGAAMRRVQDQRQPGARRIAPPQDARDLETRYLAPHCFPPDRKNTARPPAPLDGGAPRRCDIGSSHSDAAEGREKRPPAGGKRRPVTPRTGRG